MVISPAAEALSVAVSGRMRTGDVGVVRRAAASGEQCSRRAFTAPDRLVRIWQSPPGYSRMEVSPPNYQDWVARSTSFEVIGAYNRFLSANLVGSGEPVRLEGAAFTAEVLDVGVQPLIGRGFTQADDVQGAPGTLLLSHATWQNQFGGEFPRCSASARTWPT